MVAGNVGGFAHDPFADVVDAVFVKSKAERFIGTLNQIQDILSDTK